MDILSKIQPLLTEQKKVREEQKKAGSEVQNMKKSGLLTPEQSDLSVWADLGHMVWKQAELGKHLSELTDQVFKTLQEAIFGDEMEEEQESKPQKAEVAGGPAKNDPPNKRQRSSASANKSTKENYLATKK